MENYYINLDDYSLSDYAKDLERLELPPSRRIILENTKERFRLLHNEGIKSLKDLLNSLKTREKVQGMARKTGCPEEFLTILVREIKSFIPAPIKIGDFRKIKKSVITKLAKIGIKTTKDLFEAVKTRQSRKSLSEETKISPEEILEVTKLTDVVRIKWVGATFARMLVDSRYNTMKKVANADYKKLYEEINKVNAEQKYYKGKLGLNDMKICVLAAKLVPDAIKY